MAFELITKLSIVSESLKIDVAQLDIDFSVDKSRTISQNKASFTIYNANEDTRTKFLRKGNNVIFEAGYADEIVSTQFVGNIIAATTQKNGRDWQTTIKCASIASVQSSLKVLPVSLSFTADTSCLKIVQSLAAIGSMPIYGDSILKNIKLPNGFVFAGTFTGALKNIASLLESYKIGMYIDNAEIVLYSMDGTSVFKTAFLTYQNGLVTLKEIANSEEIGTRVGFTSVLIPTLKPNGVATIKTGSTLDGSYLIDTLSVSGKNYGGASVNMSCEGITGE